MYFFKVYFFNLFNKFISYFVCDEMKPFIDTYYILS